ncbi:flagellin [Achromobacter xylosoxidans]
MAAVINTNYLSLVAQNNLNKSQSALGTAIERLSSGLRINSAKDDAAGMAIANRFTANVKGLTQAARNANDGISLAQTTEGASSEVNTHLQRVRELAVQAGNGNYSQEQLDSMQDEINQRLSDINRISQQTDFNGVKVLSANAKPLTLQVGANDGETITLNLSEISVKTLGLNGFNVNGKGVTDNRSATVTDVMTQGGTADGNGNYVVNTKFANAGADAVFSKLNTGDTVQLSNGATTKYTYDAAKGTFSYDKTVDTTPVAGPPATPSAAVTTLAGALKPASGTVTGSYEYGAGKVANFETDAAGNITIDGKAAYFSSNGELSTNASSGTATQAKLEDVLTTVGTKNGASMSLGGVTYSYSASNTLTYKATASAADVKAAMSAGAVKADVTLGSGISSATVSFDRTVASTGGDPLKSSNTFVDNKGTLTKVGTFDTTYAINKDTGEVTVVGDNSATAKEYASAAGAKVMVGSDGKLTTSKTSAGTKTTDPLKTLDAAFKVLNKLTGELGAVQNRLESTIANLNNVVNNLSGARSRIQDADYATEVSNMSKNQILQQAGTSVLAQANQVPQTVLSLLR